MIELAELRNNITTLTCSFGKRKLTLLKVLCSTANFLLTGDVERKKMVKWPFCGQSSDSESPFFNKAGQWEIVLITRTLSCVRMEGCQEPEFTLSSILAILQCIFSVKNQYFLFNIIFHPFLFCNLFFFLVYLTFFLIIKYLFFVLF